jgi:germination protein M
MVLIACNKEEPVENEMPELGENQIYLYCVNHDKTDVVPVVYTVKEQEDISLAIVEVVNQLEKIEATEEYQSPIPNDIVYKTNQVNGIKKRADLSFDILYDSITADQLLFFKTCVVNSILQIEGISALTISLTDIANTDKELATVTEYFDIDSFVLSFGDEKGYTQTGVIDLYFANETGEYLKKYRKSVEISNTTSLERIVVESLIAGPKREGYTATLLDTTSIRSISLKDGICYLDLSDEFYSTENSLKNDIVVYSVVNSLVELPTITKVQFLKNGEKVAFFRETMPFDTVLERNLDLIEPETTEEN